MDVFDRIAGQIDAVQLPLFAVTLTAIPRANTPVLLMLHWHGFRRDSADAGRASLAPVPGSALQINERWMALESLDEAHREVILLRKLQELSFREISERMGRSPDACRMLLARALTELTLRMEAAS